MDHRSLLSDAWQLVADQRRLLPYAFAAELFAAIVVMAYFVYQLSRLWYVFDRGSEMRNTVMHTLIDLVQALLAPEFITYTLITVVLVVVGNFFVPLIIDGGVISAIHAATRGGKGSVVQGGLRAFWPLSEYRVVTSQFSPLFLLSVFFLLLGLFHGHFLHYWAVWVGVFSFALLIGMLFTFAEYLIVVDGKRPLDAMISSGGIVVSNVHHILIVFTLLAWVVLRTGLNMVLFLAFPAALIGGFWWLTNTDGSIFAFTAFWIAMGILFFLLIYLFAVIYLLKTALWQLLLYRLRGE